MKYRRLTSVIVQYQACTSLCVHQRAPLHHVKTVVGYNKNVFYAGGFLQLTEAGCCV